MIVALTGRMQVGKTTAADFLVSKGFVKVGFKDALVKELAERFPDLLKEIAKVEDFDPAMRTKGPLLRALMQNYGTEVRRKDDTDYWSKKWREAAYSQVLRGNSVVCDDLRFLNEVTYVKDLGGIVVRLTRPDITDTGTHQSEVEMDAIVPDFTIESTKGDIEGLFAQVGALLSER